MLRLWPRSLVGQLLLVTALALLGAQALSLSLLVRAGANERLSEISGFAAARIVGAVDRELSPDDADSADKEDEMLGRPRARRHGSSIDAHDVGHKPGGGRRGVRIVDAPPPSLANDRWNELSARVVALLGDSRYRFTAVRSAVLTRQERARMPVTPGFEGQTVLVAAHMNDGGWVVARVFAREPGHRLPSALLVQTLLIYVLLLGPIMWIGWHVSRPLKRLSRAMGEPVGRARPDPVGPGGPGDVSDLIDGFNSMRERIAAMLADKDRMLGAIGHDLRTPLASLRVRVENVRDDALRTRMVASVDAITAMLDDILSLARVGRSQEDPVESDIAALADALAEDYRDMGADVTFVEAVAPANTTARVRRDLLRRAIRNLVDNAIKYGTRARLSVESDAGGVTIDVRDDGPGIAEDRIADLIEPFARDESSRNRDTGGAGLGLAIAKAIVEHEGGRLELAKASEGGLSARIVLPRGA